MKKILIATTALTLSAGFAAADVKVGGYGYVGIVNTGAVAATGTAAQITAAQAAVTTAQGNLTTAQDTVATNTGNGTLTAADEVAVTLAEAVLAAATADLDAIDGTAASTTVQQGIRLEFTGSTTTTAGTSFSAYVRMNAANTGAITSDRARITVKHEGFTVAFGNTNGAMRTLARSATYYGFNDGGIFGADNGAGALGVQTDGGNNIMARYDMGAFSVAASTDVAAAVQEVAVRYSANGLTVGLGLDTASRYMAMVGYKMGDISVTAGWGSNGVAASERIVAGLGYKMGDWDMGLAVSSVGGTVGYGADVGYNLGGGARLSATAASVGGVTTVGAGAFFSF